MIRRTVNARRALTDEKCTVIFATAQALQQFVHFFKQVVVWKDYPHVQIGFMDIELQSSTLQIVEQTEFLNIT